MDRDKVIKKIEEYVEANIPQSKGTKEVYLKHVFKVRDYAVKLVEKEQGNKFVCELAALLHDVMSDEPDHAAAGAENSKKVLSELGVDKNIIKQVSAAIKNHSRGYNPKSLEGRIVQDADGLAFLAVSYKDYFNYFREEFDDFKKAKEDTILKLKQMREKIKTDTGVRYSGEFFSKALSWLEMQTD